MPAKQFNPESANKRVRDPIQRLTEAEWRAEGVKRFGENPDDWRFVCPCCQHVASVREWAEAGERGQAGYSCIGRLIGAKRDALGGKGEGPCNYAGGGLFTMHPVWIKVPDGVEYPCFKFADATVPAVATTKA